MRPAKRLVVSRALLVGVTILAGIGACGKEDPVKPLVPQNPYLVPSSPSNVLKNLVTAYTRRDSVQIGAIYDSLYTGETQDQWDPSNPILTFDKSDEVAHVAALARSTRISLIQIQLNTLTHYTDAADPPGWATMLNPLRTLQIIDGIWDYHVDLYQETVEFKFIPHTPDATSPTDTTWKVIRWTEIRDQP